MSSRSSVYSDNSRLYTPEMLLQFAATGLSSSPTSSLSSLSPAASPWASTFKMDALSAALENFPDISTVDVHMDHLDGLEHSTTTTTAADENGKRGAAVNVSRSSTGDVHKSITDGQDDESIEQFDGFVYGQGDIRSDLDQDLVDQLSKAIHAALSPRIVSSSTGAPKEEKTWTPLLGSLPPVVLVDSPRPRAFAPYHYPKRTDTLRKSGDGVFGDRRLVRGRTASTSRPVLTRTGGGAFNNNHRGVQPGPTYGYSNHYKATNHGFARRHEQPIIMGKEDQVTSWRKLEEGLKWSWDDDAGAYVMISA